MSTEPLLGGHGDDPACSDPQQGGTTHHYHSINSDQQYSPLLQPVVSHDGGNTRGEDETHVYRRRWYILILFSLMCGTQGCVWNTFGPISSTAEDAFDWDTSNIGMLTNWGPISFIPATVPLIWALEHKGLRVASLWTAFFVASGTVVRIFTMEPPGVTILMNVGQALNGLAGPIAMAGPPAVSATWFPPEQRTLATSIGTFFSMFGMASGFLIGPMLVPDVPKNSTDIKFSSLISTESKAERVSREREAIHRLMYIECGWACMLFLLIFIYLPKKPPLPPSVSATVQRDDFFVGIQNIVRLPQFWILGISYGLSQGVLNCWSSVINVILKPHGISESEAGWIGFGATCGGCVMSVLFAALADRLKRAMKWFVVLFYALGTAAFLTFALAADSIIHLTPAMYISAIVVGTTAVYAATPLIFELTCEVCYPTGEGTANGLLTLLNSIFGGVFLLIMLDPSIGTEWMNWTLVGSCAVCVPLLFFMEANYNRDVDSKEKWI
ncbi:solute carrier family 49 member 4-like isoform X2 [Littorina saxatilis]|uniref:solute carrier family 49 member 4-like isoform X2 n=1 Tax=Littorina saxatilis TaxID=31220 RepID=UPI0038B48CE7